MLSKFNFDRVIANAQRMKKTLPKQLAAVTKEHFVGHFASQSSDEGPWQEVKRRQPGTRAYKYAKPASRTRNILIGPGSGHLRKAVNGSLVNATFQLIRFVVKDVPHAAVHNYGLRAGRGSGFKMPERNFIKDTEVLRVKQRHEIHRQVDKIWST